MPLNLKDKSCLIYDYGLFLELAIKLSESFKRTMYYVPWKAAFPRSSLALIGNGISGLERVLDFWDAVPDADLIVFPDIYDGDIQNYLRKNGKRVWGSGKGDALELDRWETKKLLKNIGLNVIHSERIIGMNALRNRLQQVSDKWIKMSRYRGDMETFHHDDYKASLPQLNEIANSMGAQSEVAEFIIEDSIPGVEIGYDAYTIDSKYPSVGNYGYEIKSAGYIGQVMPYKNLPSIIQEVNEKLAKTFKNSQYRNFFSAEIRIGPDKKGYVIDPCCRVGCPPGGVQTELFKNLPEILWFGAEGVCIDPEPAGKFSCELILWSSWAKTNWLEIRFPKEIRKWVKLRSMTFINESYYIVPQHYTSSVGTITAVGDSMESVIADVKKRAEKVKGFATSSDADSLDKAKEEIEKGRKYGINW